MEKKRETTSISPRPDAENRKKSTADDLTKGGDIELVEEELKRTTGGIAGTDHKGSVF
jgi:hypothetical protein